MVANRPGSLSSGVSTRRTHSDVQSGSSTISPPPERTTGAAMSSCSPLPMGSGTYAAGSPTAVISITVLAPARHSARSAAA